MIKKNRGTISTQTKLQQKIKVLDYHNYQLSVNPKHKQADTVDYFNKLKEFSISKSAFNRWVLNEQKLREDFNRISGRTGSITRYRNRNNPTKIKIEKFFKDNLHIFKCLEIYYVQNILIEPDDVPIDKEVLDKFNEFKTYFNEKNLAETILIDNESWTDYFVRMIKPKLDSIRENIEEIKRIDSISTSLITEKIRIKNELEMYSYDNIYYFNELILDLDNLYELTNFKDEIFLRDGQFRNEELDLLTGDMRLHNTVSISLCGNLNGNDFLSPLIVSNLLSIKNKYNNILHSNDINSYYYHPEGLNSSDVFQNYLNKLNTRLFSENRRIKIILDNYWSHFGFLNNFSNILLLFINSRFDRTISSFNSNLITLPYDMGLERLSKLTLKVNLFKLFYKNSRFYKSGEDFLSKNGDLIIDNLKIDYKILVNKFLNEEKYNKFYNLNIVASRLLNLPDEKFDDSVENRSKFNLEKGVKLTTSINSIIPRKLKDSIKFVGKLNYLIVKDDELKLKGFIKQISSQIIKSNKGTEINLNSLNKILLTELSEGRNEKKYNKQYSNDGIFKLVKKQFEFEKISKENNDNNSSNNNDEEFEADLIIDKILVGQIQPYLIKSFNENFTKADKLDENESSKNDNGKKLKISFQTLDLFNKFYNSYLNDTTNFKPISNNNNDSTALSDKTNCYNHNTKFSSDEESSKSFSESESVTSSFLDCHRKRSIPMSGSPSMKRSKIIEMFQKIGNGSDSNNNINNHTDNREFDDKEINESSNYSVSDEDDDTEKHEVPNSKYGTATVSSLKSPASHNQSVITTSSQRSSSKPLLSKRITSTSNFKSSFSDDESDEEFD